ncbi:MAG: DUF305 domain-containing protein [Thermodesulfovibrionales bacterium]
MKTIPVFLVLALVSSAGWAGDHGSHQAPPPSHGRETYNAFEKQMNTDMEKMMKEMQFAGYSGDPDIDFLAMMIPHHQGAIDMAKLQLIHGRDPLVRKLAEDIIAAQRVEIEAMTRRLEFLRGLKGTEGKEFPALGGTRGGGAEGP